MQQEAIVSDRYMAQMRKKYANARAKLAKRRQKEEAKKANAEREIRRLDNIDEGIGETLESYDLETDEERRNREFGNLIRDWHREVRYQLSGVRLAKRNGSKDVLIFDLIYDKWTRKGRPVEGVSYSFDSLWIRRPKDRSTPVPRMPRRTLVRVLSRLVKPNKYTGEPVLKRQRLGHRSGRGGRDVTRYSFPTFPNRTDFDRNWEAMYGGT